MEKYNKKFKQFLTESNHRFGDRIEEFIESVEDLISEYDGIFNNEAVIDTLKLAMRQAQEELIKGMDDGENEGR